MTCYCGHTHVSILISHVQTLPLTKRLVRQGCISTEFGQLDQQSLLLQSITSSQILMPFWLNPKFGFTKSRSCSLSSAATAPQFSLVKFQLMVRSMTLTCFSFHSVSETHHFHDLPIFVVAETHQLSNPLQFQLLVKNVLNTTIFKKSQVVLIILFLADVHACS